ncbi:LUD domain-containing protein [Halorubrum salsamenti]|jgi:L-lactate dehydrogenase complex protein LldG|uniref:LUD domain-containing protein n=1 Tax=Halorubrum salsamenti TaxID=2583990 RepID=UPI0011AB14EB|nr:LUD domain-containing protein [Halorubrum salsamenti]
MSATPTDSLVSTLGTLDVPCEQTTPEAFEEALSPHLRGRSVGVELDGIDASLTRTDVEVDPTPAALKAATTGVTPASFAIGDYGSVVVPESPAGSDLVSLFVDRHVAIVNERDVVPDMEAAFDRFGEAFRERTQSGIIATGPSATADMGELVRGAHGPSEVHVLVVEAADE